MPSSAARTARHVSLVTAGTMIANGAAYLLQVLAGRWLGIGGFSAFASLLAVQLLCAVPALALQNVLARELVQGGTVPQLRALRSRCAGVVGAAALVLLPVVTVLLRVGPWAAGAALAAAPALVLLSGEQGLLQGKQRFRMLAVVLAVAGLARMVPALPILAGGGSATAALWAITAGITGSAVFSRILVGKTLRSDDPSPPRQANRRWWIRLIRPAERSDATVRSVLAATQVQAALMALSSVDLLVARMVLDPADASRYALGTIATKITFWLPQAIGVVWYPRMSRPTSATAASRVALGVLMLIGLLAVVTTALTAPLAPILVGPDYAPIEHLLWLFALHGALLAILQGALLAVIAGKNTRLAALAWAGLVGEIVLALTIAHTPLTLLTIMITIAATTAAIVTLAATTAATSRQSPSAEATLPRQ